MTRTLAMLTLVAFVLLALPRTASAQPGVDLPNFQPYSQEGVSMFEPPKEDEAPDTWLRFGVGFTQQFQALDHSNEAEVVLNGDDVNVNELIEIGPGFNLATANLNVDAFLAEGIRVNLITYLSARHHPEAWVKGGYVQVDGLPFGGETVDALFDVLRLRVGHMEINYGDAHFRRTDNGNAMYNPFIGNYIMDAFTTEIGGEVYAMKNGFLGMVGITDGEIRGRVDRPDDRAPSFYGKLGYDGEVSPGVRVRLTGSAYTTSSSVSNTLYGGDRAGSRFYSVLENTLSDPTSNFTSGRINPGFRDNVTAFQINPFLQVAGAEFFGVIERASGRAANETKDRTWMQYGVEGLYRFAPRDQVYLGARYNRVSGELAGSGMEVAANRIEVGGGWFVTPYVLVKGTYVRQQYEDYPSASIFHEGEFDGFMLEGVIAF